MSYTIQVAPRPESKTLHVQVGEHKNYQKLDLPLTKKMKFSGLKKTTSLYGSSTVYYVIPKSKLEKANRAAFQAKHGFSLAKVAELAKGLK